MHKLLANAYHITETYLTNENSPDHVTSPTAEIRNYSVACHVIATKFETEIPETNDYSFIF